MLNFFKYCCMGFASIFLASSTYSQSTTEPRFHQSNANRIANWLLENRSLDTDVQTAWGTTGSLTSGSQTSEANMYSGTAGIVYFLERLPGDNHHAVCEKSCNYLVAMINELTHSSDPGLFTGFSGYGAALLEVMRERNDKALYLDAVNQCVERLKNSAKTIESEANRSSVTWNQTTDVISGSAGIGLFLLNVDDFLHSEQAFELALAAGDGLISQARMVELGQGKSGLHWMMNPQYKVEMPNYSHGTTGVCDFLLILHEHCLLRSQITSFEYDNRFLDSAKDGAEYLLSLESKEDSSGLICHHFPDGEELFYLGWCHGPVGTCRFFDRLANFDADLRWAQYVSRASERMLQLELHKTRTDGFWENVGLCCGSAGVGSFFLDRYQATEDKRFLIAAQQICADIMKRATIGETKDGTPTLCWESAEHRVRPDFIQTQTGLMQGAAGVGLFILQLDAAEQKTNEFSVFGMFD